MIAAVVSGIVFAVGLAISGMTDPRRVIGFLDVTGDWDPRLALVMVGAIAAYFPFVRIARQRSRPLFATKFHWPENNGIDAKLVVGSALFGAGWGLSGYCPGPALVSLGKAMPGTFVFVLAMLGGIALTRFLTRS